MEKTPFDIGHFFPIHNFDFGSLVDYEQDGTMLKFAVQLKPQMAVGKNAQMNTENHGLGFSFIEMINADSNFSIRVFNYKNPLDAFTTQVRLGVSFKKNNKYTPNFIFRPFQHLFAERIFWDAKKDAVVWNTQKYNEKPLYVKEDALLIKYRKWTRQFHHNSNEKLSA